MPSCHKSPQRLYSMFYFKWHQCVRACVPSSGIWSSSVWCRIILLCLIRGHFGAPQVHNAGNKLGRRCDMCSNYEKQLQGIQIQEAETRDQVSFTWMCQVLSCWFSLEAQHWLSPSSPPCPVAYEASPTCRHEVLWYLSGGWVASGSLSGPCGVNLSGPECPQLALKGQGQVIAPVVSLDPVEKPELKCRVTEPTGTLPLLPSHLAAHSQCLEEIVSWP